MAIADTATTGDTNAWEDEEAKLRQVETFAQQILNMAIADAWECKVCPAGALLTVYFAPGRCEDCGADLAPYAPPTEPPARQWTYYRDDGSPSCTREINFLFGGGYYPKEGEVVAESDDGAQCVLKRSKRTRLCGCGERIFAGDLYWISWSSDGLERCCTDCVPVPDNID